MEYATRSVRNRPAILWTNNAVTCTSVNHDDGLIEVRLVVVGATVQREFFRDPESAAQFAIDKMHVYNPKWPT
jgi:hypothetical protein